MKKFILALVFVTFCGCQKQLSKEELAAYNKNNLSEEGQLIGKLPDGREVVMYTIYHGGPAHYIYVVKGSESVTVNTTIRRGKTNIQQVTGTVEEE